MKLRHPEYEYVRTLGASSSSTVYLYKRKSDGIIYAVKKLQSQQNCVREMEMLRAIHAQKAYKLFVKLHRVCHTKNAHYIFMGKHNIIILYIDHFVIVIRCN